MSEPSEPVRHQRVAAYVVCLRPGPDGAPQILLAQLSARTGWPGAWTLPGGGVEHGEHPRDALIREVHEETGLGVEVGQLLDVDSLHFTGHSPQGRLEDYHSVRLVFVGRVPEGAEPVVQEVDGSTAASAWQPIGEVLQGRVQVTSLVDFALDRIADLG